MEAWHWNKTILVICPLKDNAFRIGKKVWNPSLENVKWIAKVILLSGYLCFILWLHAKPMEYTIMLHFWRFLSIENLVGYFELFWRHIYINAPNTAWRYIDRSLQALQTLYWPLKFSGSREHRFEIMTGTWQCVRRYSWRPENLLVLRCP